MMVLSRQKIRAEMWDRMQHVMERYNDHMVHGFFKFDVRLDIELIKRAVSMIIDKNPIFKSLYRVHFFDAYWRVIENYDINKTVTLKEVDNAEVAAHEFLGRKIDERKEPQFFLTVFRDKDYDVMAILHNHMVMDGGDYKAFLAVFSALYNDLLAGGDGSSVTIKNGTRSERQLFREFTPEQKEKYAQLLSYSKKQKDKIVFPYQDYNRKNLKAIFSLATLSKEDLDAARVAAKKYGISVNTLLFTCFYRATYRLIDIPKTQALGVPCMIDLRARYLSNKQSDGFCNLTSMVVPNIGSDIGATPIETANKLAASFEELLDINNFPGLHGLVLLDKVFEIAPYLIAKFLIGTFFKNPLIGISNIGIIDEKSVTFGGTSPVDAWLTGSIKYPPYIQLSTTTYRGAMTFEIASYISDKDKPYIDKFYEYLIDEFKQFAQL